MFCFFFNQIGDARHAAALILSINIAVENLVEQEVRTINDRNIMKEEVACRTMVQIPLSNLFLERRDGRRKFSESLGPGASLAPHHVSGSHLDP